MSATDTTHDRSTAQRRAHRAGLRTVAFWEALKGGLALLGAYVFIRMIRRDVDFGEAAEHILFLLHINPHHHWSQQFLHAADKVSSTSIAMIMGIALAYAVLRFIEGYGLWRQRVWAEWLAIISGCIYLPFEIYKVIRHPNELHWVILGINILVVLYIAWVRWDEIMPPAAQQAALSSRRRRSMRFLRRLHALLPAAIPALRGEHPRLRPRMLAAQLSRSNATPIAPAADRLDSGAASHNSANARLWLRRCSSLRAWRCALCSSRRVIANRLSVAVYSHFQSHRASCQALPELCADVLQPRRDTAPIPRYRGPSRRSNSSA